MHTFILPLEILSVSFSTLPVSWELIYVDHFNGFPCPLDSGLVLPVGTAGKMSGRVKFGVFILLAPFLPDHDRD